MIRLALEEKRQNRQTLNEKLAKLKENNEVGVSRLTLVFKSLLNFYRKAVKNSDTTKLKVVHWKIVSQRNIVMYRQYGINFLTKVKK